MEVFAYSRNRGKRQMGKIINGPILLKIHEGFEWVPIEVSVGIEVSAWYQHVGIVTLLPFGDLDHSVCLLKSLGLSTVKMMVG